jgi:hypothetical protein
MPAAAGRTHRSRSVARRAHARTPRPAQRAQFTELPAVLDNRTLARFHTLSTTTSA